MSATASRIVYRHRHAGCNGSVPLNLAERELITGRSLTQLDVDRALWNVQQDSVIVVGGKKRQHRKAAR